MSVRLICAPVAVSCGDDVVLNIRQKAVVRGTRVALLDRRRFRFVMVGLSAAGGYVARDVMIEAVYGDNADGGPLDPLRVFAVDLVSIRRALAPLGITIMPRHGQGWEFHIAPAQMRAAA